MEKTWGGTPMERMEAKYRAYSAQVGTAAPTVGDDQDVQEAIIKADNTEAPANDAAAAPDARPEEPPSPAPSPEPKAEPAAKVTPPPADQPPVPAGP